MTIAESLMSKAEIEFLKKYVDLRYFCKECRYKYYEKNVFKNLAKNFKGVGGMELFLGKPEEMRLVNSNRIFFAHIHRIDLNSHRTGHEVLCVR